MTINACALSLFGSRNASQARSVRDTLLFAKILNTTALAADLAALYTNGRGSFLMFATGGKRSDNINMAELQEYVADFQNPLPAAELAMKPYSDLKQRVGDNHWFAMLYDPSSSMGGDNTMIVGYKMFDHPSFVSEENHSLVCKENLESLIRWKDALKNKYDSFTTLFDFLQGVSVLDRASQAGSSARGLVAPSFRDGMMSSAFTTN
jgi:hypothetical protein